MRFAMSVSRAAVPALSALASDTLARPCQNPPLGCRIQCASEVRAANENQYGQRRRQLVTSGRRFSPALLRVRLFRCLRSPSLASAAA
jgi:hypothetical protein